MVRNKIFSGYVLGSFLCICPTVQRGRLTARGNINGLVPESAGDREMRILEERKRKMVVCSIGWNWMATFCWVHFVRGSMVVYMDVTSTEVCVLCASSS